MMITSVEEPEEISICWEQFTNHYTQMLQGQYTEGTTAIQNRLFSSDVAAVSYPHQIIPP